MSRSTKQKFLVRQQRDRGGQIFVQIYIRTSIVLRTELKNEISAATHRLMFEYIIIDEIKLYFELWDATRQLRYWKIQCNMTQPRNVIKRTTSAPAGCIKIIFFFKKKIKNEKLKCDSGRGARYVTKNVNQNEK